MAILTAEFQYDFDRLSMNWYYRNEVDQLLRRAQNDEPGTRTYSIFTEDNAWALHGTGLRYDVSGDLTRGTVEGMSEWYWDDIGLEYVRIYLLEGIDVSALDVFNAAQTKTRADDRALLEDELSGKDIFRLSSFDDNARGFGGAMASPETQLQPSNKNRHTNLAGAHK